MTGHKKSQPMHHCMNVANLCLTYMYSFGVPLSKAIDCSFYGDGNVFFSYSHWCRTFNARTKTGENFSSYFLLYKTVHVVSCLDPLLSSATKRKGSFFLLASCNHVLLFSPRQLFELILQISFCTKWSVFFHLIHGSKGLTWGCKNYQTCLPTDTRRKRVTL